MCCLCAGYVFTFQVQLTSWLNATDEQQVIVSTVAQALPAVSVQSGLVVTPVSAFTVIDGVVSVPAGCVSSNEQHRRRRFSSPTVRRMRSSGRR